ncbi:alpha-1,3-mannosyl-glycoprotein 2-beta-N-acetylglucosaminyltransferase isoform X2 [Amborella trichopoda]|uniref:alpha-1,3-mannosyl-glycoprotein 2-beta-N-acetylglucosaminyltransferase isoform X2 n=1 Tax=Amborella trichopoda TaxID=13333 RepID=UPI0009BD22FE|nr:alpha-1,3-mannosyl-glycoprotein 2-beta-N-acetylglucosaminyltransferase isoform X2 [Amborella trichopoda]|eukprot:XP_020530022.1 alpha-1,3-mannosyl-glycoprotein 2-beta-N-acetylglucosaminyltransferase isoform X2 [Amborella trichopoda]
MARNVCDFRILLLVAAAAFIFIQVESESHCTSQMRLLIDQISIQQGKIVALDEEKKLRDDECQHLKALVDDLEKKGVKSLVGKNEHVPVAAVVVMACNRPDYLERTIQSILKYHKSVASKFPLFVSQDGTHETVKSKALSYDQVTYMQHIESSPIRTERPGELIAYYKIANHYKWALHRLFDEYNFSRVIILEDDMEIAPDFFDYFGAASLLLEKDNTIMAVSSWNDNGQKQFVQDPEVLYRSDFFPGLGWMLTKSVWDELSPKWPKAYWDDWMRLKDVRKDRQFIRPEICRTYNFGEHGSSLGQFFRQYLESIKLNDVLVDWKSKDLSYLQEEKFLKYFASLISNAKPVHGADAVFKAYNIDGDVRMHYQDQMDFERIARQFGIFEEWKDGIPRTSYKGVVVFRWQTSRRIFLVGPDSLKQLGIL